jgi:hypothetical protein
VLHNHAHGTITDFGGVAVGFSHSLILSRVEASTKPGAIQLGFVSVAANTGVMAPSAVVAASATEHISFFIVCSERARKSGVELKNIEPCYLSTVVKFNNSWKYLFLLKR